MGASQSATQHEEKETPLKLTWDAKIKGGVAIAYSRDGRMLAVGTRGGGVYLVDAASDRVLQMTGGHNGWVNSVAFSPDGLLVASASDDKTVMLWDTTTGGQVRVLRGYAGNVLCLAFSPDGRTLVTGSDDHLVGVWSVETGDVKRWSDQHTGNVVDVAVSPDGRTIASASCDETAALWDLATGLKRAVLRKHTTLVQHVVFSHNGTMLATSDRDGNVALWDVRSGRPVRTMEGYRTKRQYNQQDDTLALAFSPDGRTLVCCKFNADADDPCGSVARWNTKTGRRSGAVWRGGEWLAIDKLSFSPDATQLAVVSYYTGNVRIFQATGMWE